MLATLILAVAATAVAAGTAGPASASSCVSVYGLRQKLTYLDLGTTTRSDRPVSCTAKAQQVTLTEPYPGIPIGPSSWVGQNFNHNFLARAWINVQTGPKTEYMTEPHASVCDFPDGDTAGTMCYLGP